MNVVVNSQLLAAELRLLNKIVPSKPAVAILGYAKLTTAEGALRFYATDMEVGLRVECPADVAFPGSIVLPVARFLALVEQFPDADVQLQLNGKAVDVRCGAFASKVPTLSADDFPTQQTVEGAGCSLDGDALRLLIARTRYAISATAQKYVLQGALLTATKDATAMVATDGKRLALATATAAGDGVDEERRAIVPTKALDVLAGTTDLEIALAIGPNHLFFASNGKLLTSRKVDGKFPKYESIVPRDNDKVAVVDRAALASALRRTTLVSEENRAVYATLSQGAIDLSASSVGMGQATERVAAEYEGKPLKVCVNGAYVLDFLNAAREQTVTLAFKDSKSAMLMTDGSDHVGVVMLMR